MKIKRTRRVVQEEEIEILDDSLEVLMELVRTKPLTSEPQVVAQPPAQLVKHLGMGKPVVIAVAIAAIIFAPLALPEESRQALIKKLVELALAWL
jgi:hypothetical protein